MRVTKGPNGLAISRVNLHLTLAKAEKYRTHAAVNWRNVQRWYQCALAMKYTSRGVRKATQQVAS